MNNEILKAFEGRWRMKFNQDLLSRASEGTFDDLVGYVKSLCLDFFEAAWLIGGGIEVVQTSNSDFEDFWNLYDKKVGRPKAEKLWAKLSAKEKADCMAYIPLYKQAQSDKQFRKNPETFLRNKSFYDEIINRNHKDELRQQRLDDAAAIIAKYAG